VGGFDNRLAVLAVTGQQFKAVNCPLHGVKYHLKDLEIKRAISYIPDTSEGRANQWQNPANKKKTGCPDKPRNSILRKKENTGFIRATHEMVFKLPLWRTFMGDDEGLIYNSAIL
jgi:hypothetical protein